jgi:hypothetical protein
VSGLLGAQRTALDTQVEQESVGPADLRAGADAEDPHDLVAVQVGAEPGQLLLLGQHRDAPLRSS